MKALSARRAFLVMVGDESDSATYRIRGRVEHIKSGRRERFSSPEELQAFFERVLTEEKDSHERGLGGEDRESLKQNTDTTNSNRESQGG